MRLSVKEFAERAGVTRQAGYKRLSTIEQRFVTVENGKKYIDSEALNLFNGKDDSTISADSTEGCTTSQPTIQRNVETVEQVKQPVEWSEQAQEGAETQRQLDAARAEIELLRQRLEAEQRQGETFREEIAFMRGQITADREQLAEKDRQLTAKDAQIAELSERLREAHILTQNAQRLTLPEGRPERRTWFDSIFRRQRQEEHADK